MGFLIILGTVVTKGRQLKFLIIMPIFLQSVLKIVLCVKHLSMQTLILQRGCNCCCELFARRDRTCTILLQIFSAAYVAFSTLEVKSFVQ